MTTYNPEVDLTIFPRINFYKTFGTRAPRRELNGRIFGWPEVPGDIDDTGRFPPAEGSTCFSSVTLPHDLGPDVTTTPTALYDLRDDCGSPTTIDLNPLN